MKYTLAFTKVALSDIQKHKKSGDKPTLKKIGQILSE
jgi:toxin YoeB